MNTFIFFTITLTTLAITSALICPPRDDLTGCHCEVAGIECRGPNVTQANFDLILTNVHSLNNNNGSDDLLEAFVMIRETNLATLDLTLLQGFRLSWLYFTTNSLLTEITGPATTENSPGLEVEYLTFVYNGLTDLSLTELLKAAGASMTILEVHGSKVQGEFLDGLQYLTYLETLSMEGNNIEALNGNQIKSNRLQRISLYNNQISQIGAGAFQLNPVEPSFANVTLEIRLAGNLLNDNNFDADNGLATIGRPTLLDMRGNQFEFISAQNFEAFLYADVGNTMLLETNQFYCDDRMRWLHDARELFEFRVTGVDCVNDPGKNIFTTDLLN